MNTRIVPSPEPTYAYGTPSGAPPPLPPAEAVVALLLVPAPPPWPLDGPLPLLDVPCPPPSDPLHPASARSEATVRRSQVDPFSTGRPCRDGGASASAGPTGAVRWSRCRTRRGPPGRCA